MSALQWLSSTVESLGAIMLVDKPMTQSVVKQVA